jgi:hypothetical protein
MSTLVIRRGTAVLGTAAALLLAVLAIAPEAGAATIYACVKSKAGTARVFTKKPKCKKGETKLSWNTIGPSGRNGANGIGGGAGKEGPAGKEGAKGVGGPAGQPQFANTFSGSLATPGSGKNEASLFTLANVTVKLGCASGGVSSLEATGPANTQAESGMVDSRENNTATGLFQQNVYNVALGTNPVFAALATDASLATVGHINATIMTPTAVVFIDAFIGTTTSSCKVSGTVFDIPIV